MASKKDSDEGFGWFLLALLAVAGFCGIYTLNSAPTQIQTSELTINPLPITTTTTSHLTTTRDNEDMTAYKNGIWAEPGAGVSAANCSLFVSHNFTEVYMQTGYWNDDNTITLKDSGADLITAVANAHAAGLKIYAWVTSQTSEGGTINLSDAPKRTIAAANLAILVQNYGFDGAADDVEDWDWSSLDNLIAYYNECTISLNAASKEYFCASFPAWFEDMEAEAAGKTATIAVDLLIPMMYGGEPANETQFKLFVDECLTWAGSPVAFAIHSDGAYPYSLLESMTWITEQLATTSKANVGGFNVFWASGMDDVQYSQWDVWATKNSGTIVSSTELINWYSFTVDQIDVWISLLQTQGIHEFTLRFNAYSEWSSETPPASALSKAATFLGIAYLSGINVNIDSHTWYTTWDNYFDDGASGFAANRVKYHAYVTALVNALKNHDAVKAFMVLNEPQAQTASASENNFILSCITTAQALTSKPVSVRFMAGYSPSTGHYSSAIDTASDYLCRNTYWDPRAPGTSVYGTTEAKMNTLISTAAIAGKELWITEFGKSNSNLESQRAYVAAFVAYAQTKDIDRVFCWVSQPSASGETYNLFTGWTPNPAWFELGNITQTYMIASYSDGHSTVSPEGNTWIIAGGSQVYSWTTDIGYVVAQVYVDGSLISSTGQYTFTNVVANHTISVTSIQAPIPPQPAQYYYVTVLNGSGGQVYPSGSNLQYLVGNVSVFTATADGTHQFTRWLLNGSAYGTNSIVSISGLANQSYMLQAEFTPIVVPPPTPADWTLTVSDDGNGSTTPASGSHVITASSVSVQATPDTGYQFKYWLIDGESTSTANPYTFASAFDETHTLKALFSEIIVPVRDLTVYPSDVFDQILWKAENAEVPSFLDILVNAEQVTLI